MNAQMFSDAMGEISTKYIEEALTYQRPVKRRTTQIWLKRCAAACLAVVFCFGTILAVNAEARAAFFGWIKEVYETHFVYRYGSEANIGAEPADYRITWLPNGYTETYVDDTEDTVFIAYANETGQMLAFSYIHNPDETVWQVNTSQSIVKQTNVNGNPADLYITTEVENTNALIWTDQNNSAFYISGYLDEETLIKVAESVEAIITLR